MSKAHPEWPREETVTIRAPRSLGLPSKTLTVELSRNRDEAARMEDAITVNPIKSREKCSSK